MNCALGDLTSQSGLIDPLARPRRYLEGTPETNSVPRLPFLVEGGEY